MSQFSFKRDSELYIVYGSSQYKLDISEINFSQTIQEDSYSNKTLQEQNFFEQSQIYKVNPANFMFTIPAIREGDLKVIFNRLLDCNEFSLYVKTSQDLFSISECAVTKGVFLADKYAPLRLKITGQGSKLTREGDASTAIPGTPVARSAGRTYNRVKDIAIYIDTGSAIDSLTEVNVELVNTIKWRNDLTIRSCESEQTLTYPTNFYLEKKALRGSFNSHIVDDFEIFKNSALEIKIGEIIGATHYGFSFDLDNVFILPRLRTGEIFEYAYTWRLVSEPASLHEIIDYVTYVPGDEASILDYLNSPILDYLNNPILESV